MAHCKKLETDPDLLVPKARAALDRYKHQLVIGNDLVKRKQEVVFITTQGEEWLRVPPGEEIEVEIVDRLVSKHSEWIEAESSKQ
jgi:phosphopantothenate-cysteine ligase